MSKLINQLKRHEGLSLSMYKCTADKWSIGYGINLEAGITEKEAEMLLVMRVEKVSFELLRKLPTSINTILNEARENVLINMAFNLGVNGLLKFKKMIAALEVGNYNEASIQMMDSKWARQVGSRAKELAEQMKTGVYLYD